MDANGHIYQAPEDQIPAEDAARYDGYERGKAENELEVSRLLLQVAAERERRAQAVSEREEALAERDAAEARADERDVRVCSSCGHPKQAHEGVERWGELPCGLCECRMYEEAADDA
jgi:hypothetical protein